MYQTDCPRADCDGWVEFVEAEGETYTANGLGVHTVRGIVIDEPSCTNECTLSDAEIARLERIVNEEWDEQA
jgi:hypothetical protein